MKFDTIEVYDYISNEFIVNVKEYNFSDESIKARVLYETKMVEYYYPFVKIIRKNNRIYVHSVFDFIEDKIIKLLFNKYDPDDILYTSTSVFKKLYTMVSTTWKTLSETQFLFAIKYALYSSIPMYFDNIIEEQGVAFILDEINRDIRNIKDLDVLEDETDTAELIERDANGKYRYSILSTSVRLRSKAGEQIELDRIFEEIQLDDTLPIVYYAVDNISEEDRKRSYKLKVFKDFNKEIVASWVVVKGILKRPKGMVFKLLSLNKENYSTINLYKNGDVVVKCKWTREDYATFGDIFGCTSNVNKLVNNLNHILGERYISNVLVNNNDNLHIEDLSIYITVKHTLEYNKIRKIILMSMSDIFTLVESSLDINYKFLNLRYIKDNVYIIIRNNITKIDDKEYKTSSVDIKNVKSEEQLIVVIKWIEKLFDLSRDPSEKDEMKLVKQKKLTKLKRLKQESVNIDAVSCQKNRQPIISSDITLLQDGGYPLVFGGKTFVCTNPSFKFPGFTTKGVPCCFKKDQRNKDIFKINTNTSVKLINKINIDDILKQHVITTDKIVTDNRIGLIPPQITRLFDNPKLFRLGTVQDSESFLNIFIKIFNLFDSLDTLKRFILEITTDDLYASLENGHMKNKLSLEKFKELVVSKNIKHYEYFTDLLSRIYKVNIIIIDVSKDSRIVCPKTIAFQDAYEYLFIVKKDNFYESLIEIKGKKFKVVFDKENNMTKRLIKYYKKSCIDILEPSEIAPLDYFQLQVAVGNNAFKVVGQTVNKINQVNYLITNYGVIPVRNTGPAVVMGDPLSVIPIVKSFKKLSLGKQFILLVKLHLLTKAEYLKPIGIVKDTSGVYHGIMTRLNIVIPVEHTRKIHLKILEASRIFIRHKNSLKTTEDLLFNSQPPRLDKRHVKVLRKKIFEELYQRLRLEMSKYIKREQSVKQELDKLIQKKDKKGILDIVNRIFKEVINIVDNPIPFVNMRQIPARRITCYENTNMLNCNMNRFCSWLGNGVCKLRVEQKELEFLTDKIILEFISNATNIMNDMIDKEILFIRKLQGLEVVLKDDDILNYLASSGRKLK